MNSSTNSDPAAASPQDSPPAQPAQSDFLTLQDFLKEVGLSYSTYRSLRAQGRTPKEIRLSKRTIRISRAAIAEWRMTNEQAISVQ